MTIRIRKVKASRPHGQAIMRTRSTIPTPKPAARPKGK